MFRLRSGRFCGLRFALLLAEQLAFHVSAVTTAEGCDLDPGSRRVQESRVRNRNVVLDGGRLRAVQEYALRIANFGLERQTARATR